MKATANVEVKKEVTSVTVELTMKEALALKDLIGSTCCYDRREFFLTKQGKKDSAEYQFPDRYVRLGTEDVFGLLWDSIYEALKETKED